MKKLIISILASFSIVTPTIVLGWGDTIWVDSQHQNKVREEVMSLRLTGDRLSPEKLIARLRTAGVPEADAMRIADSISRNFDSATNAEMKKILSEFQPKIQAEKLRKFVEQFRAQMKLVEADKLITIQAFYQDHSKPKDSGDYVMAELTRQEAETFLVEMTSFADAIEKQIAHPEKIQEARRALQRRLKIPSDNPNVQFDALLLYRGLNDPTQVNPWPVGEAVTAVDNYFMAKNNTPTRDFREFVESREIVNRMQSIQYHRPFEHTTGGKITIGGGVAGAVALIGYGIYRWHEKKDHSSRSAR